MKNKQILYIASEFVPYLSETSISDMAFEVAKIAHHEGATNQNFYAQIRVNQRKKVSTT